MQVLVRKPVLIKPNYEPSSPSDEGADTATGALHFLSNLKEMVNIFISKAYYTIVVRVSMVATVSLGMCQQKVCFLCPTTALNLTYQHNHYTYINTVGGCHVFCRSCGLGSSDASRNARTRTSNVVTP
jgi:hypothetical protein